MSALDLPYFKACSDQRGHYWTRRKLSADQIIEAAAALLEDRMQRGQTIDSADKTRQFLSMKLGHLTSERFAVLFLDNKHRLISFEIMFRGSVSTTSVHPREIVRRCLELNAAAVILAHNHPSGCADPSHGDIDMTNKLTDALALIDVRVLDHAVVGGNDVVLFSEAGLVRVGRSATGRV